MIKLGFLFLSSEYDRTSKKLLTLYKRYDKISF